MRITKRAYPMGVRSGDEYLTSDVDLFNHVLTALKELIKEERITKESELDLNMKCSVVKALQDYYAIVKAYAVAISPSVPLAILQRPPHEFSDLLPPRENDVEMEVEYGLPSAKPVVQRDMFPEPPTRAEVEETEEDLMSQADRLLSDDVEHLSVSDRSSSSKEH